MPGQASAKKVPEDTLFTRGNFTSTPGGIGA
jgi:hypothetical protein